MEYDFDEFFNRYEDIVSKVDDMVARIKSEYPQEVTCKVGCTDCCYAMFDLTLIEAMYLNKKFYGNIFDDQRSKILENADRADREAYRIKRKVYKEHQKGVPDEAIFEEVGKKRVRCPLLTDSGECILYTYRPITCRVYGVPMYINGEVHTCAQSGFVTGKQYPAIYIEKIHQKLLQLSHELVGSIPTKHIKLGEVLVPVSMALLTEYNNDYLGIINPKDKECESSSDMVWTISGPQGDNQNE